LSPTGLEDVEGITVMSDSSVRTQENKVSEGGSLPIGLVDVEGIKGMSGLFDGSLQEDIVEDYSPFGGNDAGRKEYGVEPNSSSLGMLVEEGMVGRVKEDLGEVLLLCEDYPSWLLLLSSSQVSGVSCLSPRAKESWFVRDSNLEASCTFITRSEVEGWFSNFTGVKRTILIQARSKDFLLDSLITSNKNWVPDKDLLIAVSSTRLRKIKYPSSWYSSWQHVAHSSVGGVTCEGFYVGLATGDVELSKRLKCAKSTVQRFVMGLQKVDVSGRTCSPPGSIERLHTQVGSYDRPHDPQVHNRAQSLLEPYRLKSVFDTNTGWVSRKLVTKEIAAAWDVPPDRVKKLESDLALGHTTVHRLVTYPPLKVLQSAFSMLQPGAFEAPLSSKGVNTNEDSSFKLSTYVPEIVLKEVRENHVKAVKSDDVATESAMWDQICVPDFDPLKHGPLLEHLRSYSVKVFVKNVKSSFAKYLLKHYDYVWSPGDGPIKVDNEELQRDIEVGEEGLRRAEESSFWNWDGGSTPFFWRWQPEVKADMRDGTKLYVDKTKLPRYTKAQQMPRDKSIVERITEKIQKVRLRGYIAAGLVLSLTGFFQVPKGEDDIRLVYDLTACGLNEALWAPNFWMPTIMNVLDCASSDSWFGDVDAGEMFLNYMLDLNIRPYAGVDISWLDSVGKTVRKWERWTRMAMGMTPSPYVTIRLFAWAMEMIKGDRTDPDNPFHWSEVHLNCPGAENYDPTMPRVYKWNKALKCIAADCVTFVDDLRTIGATWSLVQRVTHRVETMMGYLGLQDATRKRRPNSRNPGEWTGSKSICIPGTGLFVTVSQKKWDKAQTILNDLLSQYSSPLSLPEFNLKDLERKVGFLVHLAMAYPLMLPFLRGFYLTMNSWRGGRDSLGWKLPARAYASMMSEMRGSGSWPGPTRSKTRGPEKVTASPLLYEQLCALSKLFESSEPTLRLIRGASIYEACYVFGDASGEGFGSSWVDREGTISFRYGIWGREGAGSSSNYRELRNLVETLERLGELGELVGREVFLFTDNSVSESIAFKGSSSSPKLYELVVRLYRLEMKFLCKIEVIHVAGTRMIRQGTDGLSRGDMYEGVMAGDSMLSHVPLHLSAPERSEGLVDWIRSWAEGSSSAQLEVLTPEGWFERGHDFHGSRRNIDGYWIPAYKPGMFLWAPPPGAARCSIEQLRQARLKRQDSLHIFVVPRLMCPEWRKQVVKASDLLFELPVGHSVWSTEMHEPLTFSICFPYMSRKPWELRKTNLMVDLARPLQKMLKEDPTSGWHVLSQLFELTRELDAMPLLRLREVLRGSWRPSFPGKPGV
jgi:hypothetical protein